MSGVGRLIGGLEREEDRRSGLERERLSELDRMEKAVKVNPRSSLFGSPD